MKPFQTCLLALALAAPALAGPLAGPAVEAFFRDLAALDAPYRVPVVVREAERPAPGARLFEDLPAGLRLHPSYEATYALCRRFDPMNGWGGEVGRAEAMGYLEGLADMAPIRAALALTGKGLDDMARVWFSRGRGFEHVFAGESDSDGGRVLGGYHFWYVHYRYEREGKARYLGADYGRIPAARGLADPFIVTGKMSLDFDGPGPLPAYAKVPRGGFTVGHSAAAMLALGYVAFYATGYAPVVADVGGRAYPWTVHRAGPGIRTLWPYLAY